MQKQELHTTIRRATHSDLLLIVNLSDQLSRSRENHIPKEARPFHQRLNGSIIPPIIQSFDPTESILASDQAGNILGYIRYSVFERSHKIIARLGYVDELYVLPKYVRMGVAKTLVQYIEGVFQGLGCAAYTLHTDPSNVASRAFYSGMGMLEVTMQYFKELTSD